MMRVLAGFLVLCGLAACGQNTATPDPGAAKFAKVCKDCHGENGEGRGTYPRLAGRPAEELVTRLKQYKSGHKTEHMSDTMRPFAQALSEQEIDQISAWLSTR